MSIQRFPFLVGWAVMLIISSVSAAEWLTDYPAAVSKAKAENKILLLNFTGSDWCGWCMQLKSEVFSQPYFDRFAGSKLVLVEIDFPRRKQLGTEQQKANEALAARFGIRGYPSIIILDANEQFLGKTGYRPGGPTVFVTEVERIAGTKLPANAVASGSEKNNTAPVAAPMFNGAPPGPPSDYKELRLKGISGPKNRRLAIINNQTLAEGEAAMVRFGQGQMAVKCVEISDVSVKLLVGDKAETKILKLGS